LPNQTSTCNLYIAILEEESENQQPKTDLENTPKHSQIYVTGIENIPSLIQLLQKIANRQYKIKALADNQSKAQPKTLECCVKIMKVLAEKCAEFQPTN
jgi:hypothetical protein